MSYTRPNHIEYPKVWSKFTHGDSKYIIKDLHDDYKTQALELLEKHFVNDEPPCRSVELHSKPEAKKELINLWEKSLEQNISIACFYSDSHDAEIELVGVNVLVVTQKCDAEEPFQTGNPTWLKLFGAVEVVAKSVDIFNEYSIERYLNAYGLVVKPEYRGRGIGTQLLLTRIPICKELDLPLTATVFTATASQKSATKAGFKCISEIKYKEMKDKYGYNFPGIESDTISSKLMILRVNID